MKTTERTAPSIDVIETPIEADIDTSAARADMITDTGETIESKTVYQSYADQIIEGRGLTISDKKYDQFVFEIQHSLDSNEDKDDKIAALEEVIENATTPAHKKLGQVAGAQVLKAYSGINHLGGLKKKYDDRMERLRSDKETDSRATRAKKWMGRVATRATVGVGAVAGVTVGAVAAHYGHDVTQTHDVVESFHNTANVIYGIGGNGSGGNGYITRIAENSHLGKGRTSVLVTNEKGSMEMAGLVPGQTKDTASSTTEAAEKVAQSISKKAEGSDVIIGHSEGTIAIAEYFQDNELDPNDYVVSVGGPYTPSQRISDNALFRIVAPAAREIGINVEQDMPGGENVMYIINKNDLVGISENGANNPGDILNRAAATIFADGHNYTSGDIDGKTPHIDVQNEDGSITRYITASDYLATDGSHIESGVGAAMAANGMHVTPEQDDFFQATRGDENGNWDMQEVADTGSVLAEQAAPGTGQIVHDTLSTPEAQVVADTYMETQTQFVEEVATVVETNPVVEESVAQVGQVWQEVAESPAFEPIYNSVVSGDWNNVVDQGVQAAQDFANNIPAPIEVPAPVVPAAPSLPDLGNTFRIPGF